MGKTAKDGDKKAAAKKPKDADKKAPAKKAQPNINNLEEGDTYMIDFDKLVKNEYQRLLRQYRVMEDERHSVAAKGNALSKQARLLDLLYAEVVDIKTDLWNVECVRNKVADGMTRRTILDILEGYDKAHEEQEFCLKNIRELSMNVDRIVKYLVDHKLKVLAIYGKAKTPGQMDKRRRILENRLYYYTTRYCIKIHENKLIRRDEINLSLKLRGLFYKRHMSLKRQLQDVRIRMGEVVFLATQAYDHRDELVTSIRAIREKNDKDNRQHVLEMKEFNRIIHHDALIRGFLQKKLCARNIDETEKQRQRRKNQNKLNMLNRQLAVYANSFRRILAKSSFSSMEGLIKSYDEKMQQNFAIFRSNCDLNHEIVALRDETVELSKEIERQYEEANQRDRDQKAALADGEKQKAASQLDLDGLKSILTETEGTMKEIIQHLETLYTTVGCSYKSLTIFLGNLDGIKPHNAIFCMKLIESRVQELVHQKNHFETRRNYEIPGAKEQRPVGEPGALKGQHSGGPFLPNVIVSSLLEDNEDDDDERLMVRPIPEADLRFMLAERMRLRKDGLSRRFSSRQSAMSRLSTQSSDSPDLDSTTGSGSGGKRKTDAVDVTKTSKQVINIQDDQKQNQ